MSYNSDVITRLKKFIITFGDKIVKVKNNYEITLDDDTYLVISPKKIEYCGREIKCDPETLKQIYEMMK